LIVNEQNPDFYRKLLKKHLKISNKRSIDVEIEHVFVNNLPFFC